MLVPRRVCIYIYVFFNAVSRHAVSLQVKAPPPLKFGVTTHGSTDGQSDAVGFLDDRAGFEHLVVFSVAEEAVWGSQSLAMLGCSWLVGLGIPKWLKVL